MYDFCFFGVLLRAFSNVVNFVGILYPRRVAANLRGDRGSVELSIMSETANADPSANRTVTMSPLGPANSTTWTLLALFRRMLSNSSTVTDGIARAGGTTNAVAAAVAHAPTVVARTERRDAWREVCVRVSLARFRGFDWNVKAPVLLERSIAMNAATLVGFTMVQLFAANVVIDYVPGTVHMYTQFLQ